MSEPDERRDALSGEEIERYARHIVLREVGGAGQRRLKASHVLVVGAGGLGSPALLYLAAAGVGTLRIVDDDRVSLSKLQRQIAHATASVGERKVESARGALAAINPHVVVEPVPDRVTDENADALLDGVDLVVEGTDNFASRTILADACEAAEVPLVTGAVGRFEGSITTLKPFGSDRDGKPLPRFHDLFPEPPTAGTAPACAEAGILGALTGIIGAMQAMEAIKELLGIGEGLAGRLLVYDGLRAEWRSFRYRRRSKD